MECAIGEAAEKVGMTTHTVRYYEQEGLLPTITRDVQDHRKASLIFYDINGALLILSNIWLIICLIGGCNIYYGG